MSQSKEVKRKSSSTDYRIKKTPHLDYRQVSPSKSSHSNYRGHSPSNSVSSPRRAAQQKAAAERQNSKYFKEMFEN